MEEYQMGGGGGEGGGGVGSGLGVTFFPGSGIY